MDKAWETIEGGADAGILIVADHASNHVPADIDLGIDPKLLDTHIATDLGVAPLARALGFSAILGGVSRLVVDLNREEHAPHLVPVASDGHAIPGNALSHEARQQRIERFWRPYHEQVAKRIAETKPKLLLSLHSFTPRLESDPETKRPWEIGILYNNDNRAARTALPLLNAAGVVAGDQLPYSGKLLNATMNRHGEANGLAYLGIEVRQDLIGDAAGVAKWAAILRPIVLAGVTAADAAL